jgi:RNA polymerase sigma-70 factor (ECF subfamily)
MSRTDLTRTRGPAITAARFDPEPWRAELLGFVRRVIGAEDAEDVVQEAFLRAIQSPPRSHARAWLYRIALNVIHDRRRQGRRAGAAMARVARPSTVPSGLGPAGVAERKDLAAAAFAAIERLPERQRLVLLLRVQRHMDYDEIAIALDCSVGAARQHFHVAVKAVRDALPEGRDA